MTQEGLWPTDLTAKREPSSESSPREILEYQARDLAEKTGGVLRRRVALGSQGEYVTLDFLIVAPSLKDYEYRLLKVRHKVLPQYPVEIVLDDKDRREAASEAEFRKQLAAVFGSEPTRRVIAELLDLSQQEGSQTKGRRQHRRAKRRRRRVAAR